MAIHHLVEHFHDRDGTARKLRSEPIQKLAKVVANRTVLLHHPIPLRRRRVLLLESKCVKLELLVHEQVALAILEYSIRVVPTAESFRRELGGGWYGITIELNTS